MGKEFIESINKEIYKLEDIEEKALRISGFQYMKKSNKLKVILRSKEALSSKEELSVREIITKKLNLNVDIDILCIIDISNISLKEIVDKHWNELIEEIIKKHPLTKNILLSGEKEVIENSLIISYGSEILINHAKKQKMQDLLRKYINSIFGFKAVVSFKFDSELDIKISEEYKVYKKQETEKIIKEIKSNVQVERPKMLVKTAEVQKKEYSNKDVKIDNENIIMGRAIVEESIPIKSVNEELGIVALTGDIFKVETRETKSGKILLTFFITDNTSSIVVKAFLNSKVQERVLENVKKGLYCKIRGEARYDNYSREITFSVRDIVKMQKIVKQDLASEKRVELHCHTTMSTMDAVTSPSKLIERAAKWGHPAIAITDHGVVQAYPEAMDAAKKHGIKVIYGLEGYLVDNGVPIVLNSKNQSIKDTYVVFDIETTGFSPKNDKIIEIGAVKVCDGKVIDRFSSFVNPERPIPFNITELTSIEDSMVKDASIINKVLPEFLDFCKGSVLVAHNAGFDCSFIKANCKNLSLEFSFSILDTVPLARFLYPDLKRVKLNIIAKHLGISLENHHRAVDDAKATAEILLKCFEKLVEDFNIDNLDKLNEEFLNNVDIGKLPMYHVIILAKNQVGLKNLYQLVSKAHLDNFYRKPRLPKTLISEFREGLIIGSACEAGQVYRSILDGKSQNEIEEIASFYDYLEIQPIDNNMFLIEKGNVKDREELKTINRNIYDLGKKLGKVTVATCDVHFMDPEDEVYRKIILAGQGFSDADSQPPLYLRTTDEMLKEFDYLGEDKAYEVVIKNTNLIANQIEGCKPIPDETYPPKIDGAEDDIKNMTLNKVHSIYGDNLPEVVQKRLDKELNSIISNGYAVLYLIAQKLVAKSISDGYLVGSRGSVGSSFVATMSDITEVNGLPPHYVCPNCKKSQFFLDGSISSGADLPDKNCPDCGTLYKKDGHDIPFETFLGFEGDKEPDIDLNFSGDNQGVIHKYTEVLFGKGFVFKAGTIGTVAEKTAYGYVRKYLDERNIIASSAEIERLTLGCTGIKRTTGQHPGGIMVVPRDNDIHNFCPIQHPADDRDSDVVTTHFDYHSISGRLLKLDILGHDDPTVLRMLQDLTGIDPKTVPLHDEKVLSLFTSPDALGITKEELECEVGTYGLPEFGTKFVRQMLLDTKPKTFADLVRISGLSHGTDVWLNNAQYYIKEGYTTLSECISTRDDIMVYLIYKGVPPKTAFNIMEKVRKGKGVSEEYEQIMKENNVPEWYIESCKKIKYMFPKGHAVAYVMMAVRIAYFKVYHPLAYYATYFTVRADDFDAELICKGEGAIKNKLQEIYQMGNNVTQKDKGLMTILEIAFEMIKRGFKFLKVDLYESDSIKFKIENGAIRPPMNSLQGVGDNAAKSIVEVRKDGEFISKEDLRIRAKISKTVIETLTIHGCLEGLGETNQISLFG
ncbi:PolC-type DNA polymerase III [Clostridium intestinale]|uniref:DNA polymerase III PolC-type n=1 Tax=Clostridium intestinale TaxID=36845 RepID=A0A7D7A0N4_9CLOT|nr:PolC-type DNA polymerase III [Clostridium intestinale]QLY82022.1 PolC-type DNA polymerase III [Clostridium intestinale]